MVLGSRPDWGRVPPHPLAQSVTQGSSLSVSQSERRVASASQGAVRVTVCEQREQAPRLGTQTLERWGPRGRLGDPTAGEKARQRWAALPREPGTAWLTLKPPLSAICTRESLPGETSGPSGQASALVEDGETEPEDLGALWTDPKRGCDQLEDTDRALLDTPRGPAGLHRAESLPCLPPTTPGDPILSPLEWPRNSIHQPMSTSGEPGATEARSTGTWTGEERRTWACLGHSCQRSSLGHTRPLNTRRAAGGTDEMHFENLFHLD